MKNPFAHLEPASLWNYFFEITHVPRPSKKEEKILEFLKNFCSQNGLKYKQDRMGNLLVSKEATPGMEGRKTVILQSHVDMVCEKNKDTNHDFDRDPIPAYVDGDWVKARGTTLGADNGIGVATLMSLLVSKDIPHGPLKCLFTVDEETGLTGAKDLDPSLLEGDVLLNLDTEDEGVFTVGCAGGQDTVITLKPAFEALPANYQIFDIEVKGLLGGHSGVDINKGRANALKILAPILKSGTSDFGLRLVNISGGNLRNALAREAHARVGFPSDSVSKFESFLSGYEKKSQADFSKSDPGLKVTLHKLSTKADKAYGIEFQRNLVNALVECPHGVLKMNAEIPNLVQTSNNLASIKEIDGKLVISTSQRSSIAKEKNITSENVVKAFAPLMPEIKDDNAYPGWEPNFKSPTLSLFKKTYQDLFGKEPIVEVIHAGLECGLLGGKNPKLDMISFGPTIVGPHSPDERVQISSVEKYWKLLLATLQQL